MPTIIQKSFKAYPATPTGAHYDVYARNKPLLITAAEFNDFGAAALDFTEHCYVAPYAQRMEFHVNLQWLSPPPNAGIKVLLMKNQLGTQAGAPGGEFAGTNAVAGTSDNPSSTVTSIINLAAGDKVWAVPCAVNGGGLDLTQSVASNGYVTVNYFTGKELAVL